MSLQSIQRQVFIQQGQINVIQYRLDDIETDIAGLPALTTQVATNTTNIATINTKLNSSNVVIGLNAGLTPITSTGIIAIGLNAGRGTTSFPINTNNVAIGNSALYTGSQGSNVVAVGNFAGFDSLKTNCVAIGSEAGRTFSGSSSIYIGRASGQNGGSFTNTIVLNATGSALNPAVASACYVAPVRQLQPADVDTSRLMTYNTTTKEISYASTKPNLARVIAVSSTAIPITADMSGQVIILTGNSTTQPFTSSTLDVNDAGLYITVKNGNFTTPTLDITISGVSGASKIHGATSSQNANIVMLYWSGTTLTAY